MTIKAENSIMIEKKVLGTKIMGLMLSLLMLKLCRTGAEYHAVSYILVASHFFAFRSLVLTQHLRFIYTRLSFSSYTKKKEGRNANRKPASVPRASARPVS